MQLQINEIEKKIKNCKKKFINSNTDLHELFMIKIFEF